MDLRTWTCFTLCMHLCSFKVRSTIFWKTGTVFLVYGSNPTDPLTILTPLNSSTFVSMLHLKDWRNLRLWNCERVGRVLPLVVVFTYCKGTFFKSSRSCLQTSLATQTAAAFQPKTWKRETGKNKLSINFLWRFEGYIPITNNVQLEATGS